MFTGRMPAGGDSYRGNDRLLFGIILAVLAFRLFARTTLNVAPRAADADPALAFNLLMVAAAIVSINAQCAQGPRARE